MSLELKKGDQIIIAVDKSGSMGELDAACDGTTRYAWMQETLMSYVRAATRFDPDGVSLIFFAVRAETHPDVATVDQVKDLIVTHRPGGGTNTHLAVKAAWDEHTAKRNVSTFLLVFTDGDASDREALRDTIVSISHRVSSPEEFRIVFLPVGTVSSDLRAFLDFLDEGLTDAKHDLVAVQDPTTADFDGAIANAIGSTTTQAENDGTYHGKRTDNIA